MISIELKQKHGLTRFEMHHKLVRSRELADLQYSSSGALDNYFILCYKGNELQRRIVTNNAGLPVIVIDDTAYNVVYLKCTPVSTRLADAVKISFRKAHEDFNLPAIALITSYNMRKK